MKKEMLDLTLEGGAMSAKRSGIAEGKPGSSVSIKSGGATVRMEEGDLTVAGDGGGLSLNVSSGSASLISGGSETVVRENSAVLINPDGSSAERNIIFKELSPANSSIIFTQKSEHPISFRWVSEGNGYGGVELLLSRDPVMKSGVDLIKASAENRAAALLKPGTYYWKLKSTSGESIVSRFTVIEENAAEQIIPRDKEIISYAVGSPLVTFQWKKEQHPSSYVVEVFSDPQMKSAAVTIPSTGSSISTNMLTEGKYFWRVKNLYGGRDISEEIASPLRSFEILRTVDVKAPILTGETGGRVISSASLIKGGALLSGIRLLERNTMRLKLQLIALLITL
jgi:hypothetical protein